MKITKQQLRQIIKEELLKETQWGGFTGGAAPLDADPVDRGPIPSGQLKQLFDLLADMGKPVEDILAMPEFVEARERLVRFIASGLPEDQQPGFIKSETRKMMLDAEYFQEQWQAYEQDMGEAGW
tara:strand:+ start:157 stop:531 length:375 start_codon:yes stop_codon:yes gene_type:complete